MKENVGVEEKNGRDWEKIDGEKKDEINVEK